MRALNSALPVNLCVCVHMKVDACISFDGCSALQLRHIEVPLKHPTNTHIHTHTHPISCATALMPCDTPPWSWKADPDDGLSEWAAWGNLILCLLSRGRTEDSWAHIKLSLCSYVKTNDRASCEQSLFSSVSTTLNQNQLPLEIVMH